MVLLNLSNVFFNAYNDVFFNAKNNQRKLAVLGQFFIVIDFIFVVVLKNTAYWLDTAGRQVSEEEEEEDKEKKEIEVVMMAVAGRGRSTK